MKKSKSRPIEERASRIALYTRISTDEEHQPYSLGAQADRLESYVKSQDGWQIWRRYEDQMTGTVLDRPGLQAALEDARRGKFDLLLVFRVDRLARSVRSLAAILEELEGCGVAFRSATEPFDTSSPAGRMMVQMLGVFAEFERATLIERVIAGMEKKAARGGWNGGTRPLGYDYDPERGCLEVNEAEASLVRQIFDLYATQKLGSASIARWLNARGRRTKYGALWTPNAVRTVIVNPVYLGKVFWRDEIYAGQHPGIVEPEVFAKTQQLLERRGRDVGRRRSNRSDYLLSGLLVCEKCRHRFAGTSVRGNGGRYRYYMCRSRLLHGTSACDQESLPADDLEAMILRHLAASLQDSEVLRRSIERATRELGRERPRWQEELRGTDKELASIRTSIDKYLRAFEMDGLPVEVCASRLQELKDRQGEVEQRKAELGELLAGGAEAPKLEELESLGTELADHLQQTREQNLPKLKGLLQLLVPEIQVGSRSAIRPVIHMPLVSIMGDWVGPAGIEPATSGL